jgi:lysozyme
MNISDEGVRLIKSFEGYHKKLANGDCTAYQTYLGGGKYDIPTIGYGCTAGITMGMIWTEAQATEALMKEVSKHESYVTQYVTVPMNQNEFDALVSFSYNCGPGNLKKLVARLNKGDRTATAKAFLLYVKAQGRTLPGLVSRRTRESALFQKPLAAPAEPYMPQTVEKSREPLGEKTAATVGTAAAVVVQQAASIPTISDLDKMVTTGQHVRSITEQAGDLGQWLYHSQVAPFAIAAILIGLFAIWKSAGTGSSGRAQSDSST